MNIRPFRAVCALTFALLAIGASSAAIAQPAATLVREKFGGSSAERWKVVSLGDGKGSGDARILEGSDGAHFLEVSTNGSFYGMGMKKDFDPGSYSEMSWIWRVTKLPENADITSKRGDDAAARVYVVFSDPSLFHPFATTALVYVWDARYPVGSVVPNPYAPQSEKAIVLESGPSRVGRWTRERVNVAADYTRVFDARPGAVKAIVFASDSDNTNSSTVSDFSDLTISSAGLASGVTPAQ